jgi:CRP-like cAMP-binding protein
VPLFSRSEFENQELLDLTYSVPLFSRLRAKYSNQVQEKFSNLLTLEVFTKNQFIYAKGDQSNKFFILLKGEVALYQVTEKEDSELSSSDDSSDELSDEDFARLLRPRSKAVTINPVLLYEISQKLSSDPNRENEIISQEALENESQELVEFIIQSNNNDENDELSKTVLPGHDFGHEALFPSKRRTMNAVAKSDVQVASISSTVMAKVIKEVSRERTLRMFDFLQSVTLFVKWSRYEIKRILGFFKLKVFTKGQFLYKQGQPPSHVFIIRKGNFALSRTIKQETPVSDLPGLRNFSSKRSSRLHKVELVIKGEKELIGFEEVIHGIPFRNFSCVCNSASAEVYQITAANFAGKLVKPELFESFSSTLKTDSIWLNDRFRDLERSDIISASFEDVKTRRSAREPKKVFEFFQEALKKPLRLHRRGLSENRKEYEKGWNVRNFSNFYWPKCETGNIHLANVKKNNPRLAPPNFLFRVRNSKNRKNGMRLGEDFLKEGE